MFEGVCAAYLLLRVEEIRVRIEPLNRDDLSRRVDSRPVLEELCSLGRYLLTLPLTELVLHLFGEVGVDVAGLRSDSGGRRRLAQGKGEVRAAAAARGS